MKTAGRSFLPSWILTAALFGLLALLATLQYRWLSEISEAHRERTRSRLERDARGFAKDFDRELTRILRYAQVVREESLARRSTPEAADVAAFYELWTDLAPVPGFLRDVFLIERGDQGELRPARFDPETVELLDVGWDAAPASLRRHLEETPGDFLDSETPAVVLPLLPGPFGRHRGPPMGGREPLMGRLGDRRDFRESMRAQRLAVIAFRLDPAKLLSALAEQHFGDGGGLELHVRVADREDPRRTVFEAGPRGAAPAAAPPDRASSDGAGDAASELFGLLSAAESRQLAADVPVALRGHRQRHFEDMTLDAFSQADRRWRLVVTHPSGSLDRAVAATRRRNLALGLGILLVLAATVLMLLRATRRSQKLARQQIEFVAGVTHELRTPLAALRSAGENLADGVVQDPSQVARYGALIAREGRRLSDMVEQVLEYAGIQSGRRAYVREPTSVADLVAGAVAERRPLVEGKLEVVTEVPDGLPPLLGDPPALRRALGNLIGNAAKYGGGWMAVRAAKVGKEVRISVADRGPGIPEEDLPHIFEPFFRGRRLAAGRVPGSGLGLSLVRHVCEAHGGRVSVTSREGHGSTFTLHLPAAPAGEPHGVAAHAWEA
jgi:signal transduction histidine kinase